MCWIGSFTGDAVRFWIGRKYGARALTRFPRFAATVQTAARLTDKQLAFPNVAGLRAALASLGDRGFLAETRTALVADRRRVHAALDRLGRPRTRSQGNFVFFDTGMPLATFAGHMLARGIRIGRHFDGYDSWARVTIGTRPEVDRLLDALPGALGA